MGELNCLVTKKLATERFAETASKSRLLPTRGYRPITISDAASGLEAHDDA
jgi:hypothetical protein